MDWVLVVFWVCAIIAFSLGAYKVAQSPSFYVGLGLAVLRAIWPYITAPEKPEDRARRQEAERRGQEWNPITKRPRER